MKSRVVNLRQSVDTFFYSIRFRLVLWFVLVLGVVMVVFSVFIYWRQSQDVWDIAMGRLNYTMERFLGSAHEREGVIEQAPLINGLSENAQIFGSDGQVTDVVALQGSDGSVQQSLGSLTTEQITQLRLPRSGWTGIQEVKVPNITGVSNDRYLFINPTIMQNGQVTGHLLVGVPLDPNNQLGRLAVSLVLGNLLTLAIALTGGFWLADRAMRPVHTITQTARQIGETDLQKRLHLRGKDELADLGNTFDEMLDRLQAAFERQRRFTADASHELRTPLTIIDLEAGRALSARRSADEYSQTLRTIQSENHFMIRLVNNLLSLARMDAGQVKLKLEPLDLCTVTSEVIERMQPLAISRGVELSVGEMPETMVQGDRATLTQMLTNLVENAIKFTADVPSPKVEISAGRRDEARDQRAWLRVQDNGIGIPPEQQAHIFDRFYQVEASRNRSDGNDTEAEGQESSGTGLGLAIAHWVARAHGGEIRVESELGKGSTFEVILPIYK